MVNDCAKSAGPPGGDEGKGGGRSGQPRGPEHCQAPCGAASARKGSTEEGWEGVEWEAAEASKAVCTRALRAACEHARVVRRAGAAYLRLCARLRAAPVRPFEKARGGRGSPLVEVLRPP